MSVKRHKLSDLDLAAAVNAMRLRAQAKASLELAVRRHREEQQRHREERARLQADLQGESAAFRAHLRGILKRDGIELPEDLRDWGLEFDKQTGRPTGFVIWDPGTNGEAPSAPAPPPLAETAQEGEDPGANPSLGALLDQARALCTPAAKE